MTDTAERSRTALMVAILVALLAVLVAVPLWFAMTAGPGAECGGTPLTDSACFR